MMRKLTEHQAKNCEEAREPACHCRCGGKAHGAKRGGGNAGMEFYYSLPEDDPHYTPSPERRKQLAAERQAIKRQARQERIEAAFKVKMDILTAKYTAQREGNYELAGVLSKEFLEAHRLYEEVRKAK